MNKASNKAQPMKKRKSSIDGNAVSIDKDMKLVVGQENYKRCTVYHDNKVGAAVLYEDKVEFFGKHTVADSVTRGKRQVFVNEVIGTENLVSAYCREDGSPFKTLLTVIVCILFFISLIGLGPVLGSSGHSFSNLDLGFVFIGLVSGLLGAGLLLIIMRMGAIRYTFEFRDKNITFKTSVRRPLVTTIEAINWNKLLVRYIQHWRNRENEIVQSNGLGAPVDSDGGHAGIVQ